MNVSGIENFVLKVLCFLAYVVAAAQVFQWKSLTSVLIAVLFAGTFLYLFMTWFREFSTLDLTVVVIMLLSFICVFVNALMAGGNVSFSYLRKWIMFSSAIAFLTGAVKTVPDRGLVHTVVICNDITALMMIEEYFRQGRSLYFINGIETRYLNYHFTNPNLTALVLASVLMMETVEIYESRSVIRKLWHTVLAGFLLYFVSETQSRNSLLAVLIFILMFFIVIFSRKKKFRTYGGLSFLIAVFPIIFAVIYMETISWITENNLLSRLAGEGKALSSRTRIWSAAFREIRQSPLIGSYYEMSGGTGISQAHNTCLDILTSYGFPVFILVMILLVMIMMRYGGGIAKKNYMYVIAFACSLLMGTGEAALFSGGLCIQILTGIFLFMANANTDGGEAEDGT